MTLFERHRYAAMETSFANGGQLSASNAEVWNHGATVAKGLKWMLRKDAPLYLPAEAVPDFGEQPKVINGCSDLLVEVLGDAGRHTRSAVGMGSLPNRISVEIEATFEFE